jgi:glycosyltransferase involved in cell wall biosynthesis
VKFSIVVPAYNAEETLLYLLKSLSNQTVKDFETIVVDDFSQDKTSQIAQSFACNLIQLSENRGPAYCRNVGAHSAQGDILVFTDSDCRVDANWLENIEAGFSEGGADAIMGKIKIAPSTVLGDSISALGFPAGGALGFDRIWKVDQNGYTDSLSTCNCAVGKKVFRTVGGFDTAFPFPGGEDSLFAFNLRRLNYRIKYCPEVRVYHAARDSLSDFFNWQFKRGISSYIFSTKVTGKRKFISLRMWSTTNIIRQYYKDRKFPLILCLLTVGFLIQFFGFFYGKHFSRA